MFDIGGFELLLIAIVGLLVIGPERLPETLRTLGLWLGRLRRSFTSVKAEIEKEVGMDEIKRQLHNEAVMEEMKRIERQVKATADNARIDPGVISGAATPTAAQPEADSGDAGEAQPAAETAPDAHSDAAAAEQPPLPPTEAELEAAYARKRRTAQSSDDEPG